MAEKPTIAFVPRRSRIRPYKIAKALRSLGNYRLVLICEEAFYDPELLDGVFDEVLFFKKKTPLARYKYSKVLDDRFNPKFSRLGQLVEKVSPDLIHAFCEPYDHIQFLLKQFNIPVVMSDGADFSGISAGIENLDRRTREQERFCFEHVAGICHKGPEYELQYYRDHGYAVHCPEIRWFDHCDADLFASPDEVTRLSQKDGKTHIVYTGLVSESPKKRYINYIPLAYELDRQGVHFHIYSNPYLNKTSDRYQALDRELEHFHLHDPVPYKTIHREIAQYDWGLWWHEPTLEKRVIRAKQKVAIGNKMFSYLEAGLPIIVGDHNEGGRPLIEAEGIGITMNRDDYSRLQERLESVDKERMDQEVIRARTKFSLSKNAGRLRDFYERVLGLTGPRN